MKKAQILSLDLIFALGIFLFVLGFLTGMWNEVKLDFLDFEETERMHRQATLAIETLLKRGKPYSWDQESVEIPGLGREPGKFSREKILAFLDLNYDSVKKTLGIGNYDFFLSVRNLDNSIITINGKEATFGVTPEGAREKAQLERLGLLNKEIAILRLVVWK